MRHQQVSGQSAQKRIDEYAQGFARRIANESLSLDAANKMVTSPNAHGFCLYQIAGLAKAIACFQCG